MWRSRLPWAQHVGKIVLSLSHCSIFSKQLFFTSSSLSFSALGRSLRATGAWPSPPAVPSPFHHKFINRSNTCHSFLPLRTCSVTAAVFHHSTHTNCAFFPGHLFFLHTRSFHSTTPHRINPFVVRFGAFVMGRMASRLPHGIKSWVSCLYRLHMRKPECGYDSSVTLFSSCSLSLPPFDPNYLSNLYDQ